MVISVGVGLGVGVRLGVAVGGLFAVVVRATAVEVRVTPLGYTTWMMVFPNIIPITATIIPPIRVIIAAIITLSSFFMSFLFRFSMSIVNRVERIKRKYALWPCRSFGRKPYIYRENIFITSEKLFGWYFSYSSCFI
jgi:hypothetical protein